MAKAILLLSGGLDSTLAGALLLELGIEVEAINFTSSFCRCSPNSLGCHAANAAAERLGIKVSVFGCGQDYLDAIKAPRFGRGKRMNACIDCRIFMFSRAAKYVKERNADFLATGEVLGERPMSQRRRAMALIERESGLNGLIVRPLCAKLLPPSLPEQNGIVDRERLCAIQGRRRIPQFELAQELGVKDYLCPAGGCLLTDVEFAARFADLLSHSPEFDVSEATLLRFGRHFRLPRGAKVVVGRNEDENGAIEQLAREGDVLLTPVTVPGPTVLVRRALSEDDISTAAGMLASYTKGGTHFTVSVSATPEAHGRRTLPNVAPLDRGTIDQWRICRAQIDLPRHYI